MKFAAVIFDLDGTIIKSEDVWGKAYLSVFKKLGGKIDKGFVHTPGVSVRSNWKQILVKYSLRTHKTPEELETLTYIEYGKLIPEVKLNDGIVEFVDSLQENGTSLALATSTNWETTSKVLEHFGLTNCFENITTGEEVENPKPAPDIFLLASEKLGVDPVDCLVIEDSMSGVTAAHEAEMKVIAVSNGEDTKSLDGADLIVEGFPEITLKAIDAIDSD